MPLSLGKQLRSAEAERLAQPAQAPQAGIAPAALDVGDPPLIQAGLVGHLLLSQPQLSPPLLDSTTESVLKRRAGSGHGMGPWSPGE
jgi:hypothetical protein